MKDTCLLKRKENISDCICNIKSIVTPVNNTAKEVMVTPIYPELSFNLALRLRQEKEIDANKAIFLPTRNDLFILVLVAKPRDDKLILRQYMIDTLHLNAEVMARWI